MHKSAISKSQNLNIKWREGDTATLSKWKQNIGKGINVSVTFPSVTFALPFVINNVQIPRSDDLKWKFSLQNQVNCNGNRPSEDYENTLKFWNQSIHGIWKQFLSYLSLWEGALFRLSRTRNLVKWQIELEVLEKHINSVWCKADKQAMMEGSSPSPLIRMNNTFSTWYQRRFELTLLIRKFQVTIKPRHFPIFFSVSSSA